jgi:hypothetical protein
LTQRVVSQSTPKDERRQDRKKEGEGGRPITKFMSLSNISSDLDEDIVSQCGVSDHCHGLLQQYSSAVAERVHGSRGPELEGSDILLRGDRTII